MLFNLFPPLAAFVSFLFFSSLYKLMRDTTMNIDRPGSGFVSKSAYHHGYFSASIKLPDDHTAGVVVAFYVSFNFALESRSGLRSDPTPQQPVPLISLSTTTSPSIEQ
jgi:hypothetical protein